MGNIYIYVCVCIKWTVSVNVATNSAQYAYARMITTVVEKIETQIIYATLASWIY